MGTIRGALRALVLGIHLFWAIGGAGWGDSSVAWAGASAQGGQAFIVEAPSKSSLAGELEYRPASGELVLLRKGALFSNHTPRTLHAFGSLPGLTELSAQTSGAQGSLNDDAPRGIEVLASSSDARWVALRHGHWVSILDLEHDLVVASNLGPFGRWDFGTRKLASRFNAVVMNQGPDGDTDDPYPGYLVFVAPARRQILAGAGTPPSENLLVMFRFSDQKVMGMALPERLLLSSALWMSYGSSTPGLKLAFDAQFRAVANGKPFAQDFAGVAWFDLEKGRANIAPLSAAEPIINPFDALPRPTNGPIVIEGGRQFLPPMPYRSLRRYLSADGISPQDVESTSLAHEDIGRETALAQIRARLDRAAENEARLRQELSYLEGQDAAIEEYVRLSHALSRSNKFEVVAVGGTTGVGKTSSILGFARASFPAQGNPFFKLSLSKFSDAQFLEAELYGAAPPYLGSTNPTGLQSWLLENPDGGVILFDEWEKASPEAKTLLLQFFDDGELKLNPLLVEALLKREPPPKHLVELVEANGGTPGEIVLKMSPRHVVFLGTNAGSEIYTGGVGLGTIVGRRLETVQEFEAATARMTGDLIKKSLRARGDSDELLNRISVYIPFKVLMPDRHNRVVDAKLAGIVRNLEKDYLIDLRLTPELVELIQRDSYSPLDGVRYLENNLKLWLERNLTMLVSQRKLEPGEVVDLRLVPGSHVAQAQVEILSRGQAVASYPIGKTPAARPTALLQRARERLGPTLDQKIDGHELEKRLVTDLITSQLYTAVHDAKLRNKPAIVYLDGASGVGKTETAKAVAEALYDRSDAMLTVNFADVQTLDDFDREFTSRLTAMLKTHEGPIVLLFDELPRGGIEGPHRVAIHNQLMRLLDEGVVSPPQHEVKRVAGLPVQVTEGLTLPAGSIIIGTGNVALTAIPDYEFMSAEALTAQFRLMKRHPEIFLAAMSRVFPNAAFRGRLGEAILVEPNGAAATERMRDRFINEATTLLREQGYRVEFAASVLDYLKREQVAAKGGRWWREQIFERIVPGIIGWVARSGANYPGAKLTAGFDDSTRNLMLQVESAAGELVGTFLIGEVPIRRKQQHPDTQANFEKLVSYHEAAGHALVQWALFGKGSVAEINTFGGGSGNAGGWMEMGTVAAENEGYTSSTQGIYDLVVAMAGHVAERIYLGKTGTGASSDNDHVRSISMAMILNGAIPGLAPVSLFRDPNSGAYAPSEQSKQRLEAMASRLHQLAYSIAHEIILSNRDLGESFTQVLHAAPSRSMGRVEVDEYLSSRVNRPDKAALDARILNEVREIARMGAALASGAASPCGQALDPLSMPVVTNSGASSASNSWWQRMRNRLADLVRGK